MIVTSLLWFFFFIRSEVPSSFCNIAGNEMVESKIMVIYDCFGRDFWFGLLTTLYYIAIINIFPSLSLVFIVNQPLSRQRQAFSWTFNTQKHYKIGTEQFMKRWIIIKTMSLKCFSYCFPAWLAQCVGMLADQQPRSPLSHQNPSCPSQFMSEPKRHSFTFHPTDPHPTTDSYSQHVGRHIAASQCLLYS